jgi:hypothetical protein
MFDGSGCTYIRYQSPGFQVATETSFYQELHFILVFFVYTHNPVYYSYVLLYVQWRNRNLTWALTSGRSSHILNFSQGLQLANRGVLTNVTLTTVEDLIHIPLCTSKHYRPNGIGFHPTASYKSVFSLISRGQYRRLRTVLVFVHS